MKKINKIAIIFLVLVLFVSLANADVPFESLAQRYADSPKVPFSDLSQNTQKVGAFEDFAQNEKGPQAPFGNIANPQDSTPLNVEGQENQLKPSWFYVAFPLILVAGLLVYVETKRRRDHSQLESQSRHNKVDSLKGYVQNAVQKGYSKEQIVEALMKNNYDQDMIEEAFRYQK